MIFCTGGAKQCNGRLVVCRRLLRWPGRSGMPHKCCGDHTEPWKRLRDTLGTSCSRLKQHRAQCFLFPPSGGEGGNIFPPDSGPKGRFPLDASPLVGWVAGWGQGRRGGKRGNGGRGRDAGCVRKAWEGVGARGAGVEGGLEAQKGIKVLQKSAPP